MIGTVTRLPEWRELFATTSDYEIGAVLAHGDLAKVLKIPYGSLRYFSQVNRWRREEQNERNRQWRLVRKVGYELVHPSDHHKVGNQRIKSGIKHIRRGVAAFQHTSMEALTEGQRTKHVDAEARATVLLQVAAGTRRQIQQMYVPPQPPKPGLKA